MSHTLGAVVFSLRIDRFKGLSSAKGLKRNAFLAAGITEAQMREWTNRLKGRVPPSASGLISFATVLEVSAEWLMGAPSRYDLLGEDYRQVAIESSFDSFLERTDAGRTLTPDIIPRLREETTSEDPPTTVARWRARADTIVRAAHWGEARRTVEDMVNRPPQVRRE